MSRVLLVGSGPFPSPDDRHTGFPQLRCAHFARAILAAGHELGLVCLQPEGAGGQPPGGAARTWTIEPERGDWIERLRSAVLAFDPQAIVSAGPYAPLRGAVLVAGDLPLWADIPGDPFAEAQARAACGAESEPLPAGPGAAQARATMAALERADAFSVCSRPQRHALLGQLGVLGRLAISSPERDWAAVIPPAYDFDTPSLHPSLRPAQHPFKVLLCGGFNTWLHDEAILGGLLQAMDGGMPLDVVVTGGAIPGHHSAGWERFEAGVRASAHRARFELHGWVSHRELARLTVDADLLLSVDRPGAEPELGSRTRLLFALHQGLEVASTLNSDIARELARRGWLQPIDAPTPTDVTATLIDHYATEHDGEAVLAAQAWLRTTHDPRHLTVPLTRWLRSPSRAPRGPGASEQVALQLAQTQAELAAVHGSPTWRTLAWMHRAAKRLGGRG